MSSGNKRDVDALLRAWPALDRDGAELAAEGDASWDARADAIVAAATGASARTSTEIDAVLGAPNLPSEPGELSSQQRIPAGEIAMSESHSGGSKSGPPPSMPGSKRTSLKEIAQRASQSGRPPMSNAGSTPLPGAAASAVATPVPAPPVSIKRAAEAGKDDSGMVDLHVVKAKADAPMIAAAEKAKPGEASLFDDDAPASAKAPASKSAPSSKTAAKAKAAPAEQGRGGMTGLVIALLGIAAGVAIWQVRAHQNANDVTAAKPAPTAAAPDATGAATSAPAGKAAPASTAVAANQEVDPDNLPPDSAPAAAKRWGTLPTPSAKPEASAVAVAAAPKPVGSSGTLSEEMRRAVGADGKPLPQGEPEPAALDSRSKTLPERPSQGAVQSAIGAVLGSAKACVADADDATRAIVTFGPSGSVSNVSVSGWAAANGKSGCVVAALKGAKVGAFTDPNYTFPVAIRP